MASQTQNLSSSNHAILGAEITGGFLEGTRLEFSLGLNCIIGGRGTGKTTLLEFVRYVLGMMPDPGRGGKSRAHSVVQSNLANGRIRLHFRTRHGMNYTAERPWNDSCQVLDENGAATAISLDRDRIFRADVYSQNEIEQIATDTGYQMKLIDQFEEESIRAINGEINRLLRDIERSGGDLAELARQMADLAETVSEGPAIEEKLKAFQKQGNSPDARLINQAHVDKALREREKKAIRELRGDFATLGGKFQSYTDSLTQRLNGYVGADILEGPNHPLFQMVTGQVGTFLEEFLKAVPWIHNNCQLAVEALDSMATELENLHASQEQSYRELMAKSQEEQNRSTERTTLQKRHLEVNDAKRSLDALKRQHGERSGLHQDMTASLIDRLAAWPQIGRLETVEMDDLPRIELLDGRDYKDAGTLSTGQRCTTILPILLLENEYPLLIDQPEDNLDNAFIFETIVKSVKEAKTNRQLIFVTHNPNIPVLGDADRVFVLSSDGRRGTITHQGTVDEVKDRIETLLEGGREAFLQRKERYGH